MEKNLKPKWLYRLEYKDNTCGLWYNGNGEWCFQNGIGALDDKCKTKNLPMDYDERYKKEGRDWFSSCSHKETLDLPEQTFYEIVANKYNESKNK